MAKGSKSDKKTTKPSAAAPAERAAKQFQKTVAPLAKAAATPAKVDKKVHNDRSVVICIILYQSLTVLSIFVGKGTTGRRSPLTPLETGAVL